MTSVPFPTAKPRIRTLLVDDEPLARERMRMLLARHPDVEVLAECADGAEAVGVIDALAPDLVFLDVEMPRLTGFDVLQNIDETHLPSVVFVSGHDKYAVRAFETHAVDYLLKPVAADRVDRTLTRIRERRAEAARGSVAEPALQGLLAQLRGDAGTEAPVSEHRRTNRLAVKSEGRLVLLHVDDVEWVEASGNYVQVHAQGATYTMRETMKRMEERLDPTRFVRIHRGSIVNVDRIKALEPWLHGEYVVILHDGTRLAASRVYVGRLNAIIRN